MQVHSFPRGAVVEKTAGLPSFSMQTVQKTGEIPQVQFLVKVDDARCCSTTGAEVRDRAENGGISAVCSALTRWSMSLLCRFIDGYGRRCDHAATSGLATVKVPQTQFIAGVGGHSSPQQRRSCFQQGMCGDEGFLYLFRPFFALLQVVWRLSASFRSPR